MADIKTQKPLDDELRTVKVNNDSTPISVSKDKVKIDGQIVDTTHFTNIRVSGDITTDNGLRISTSDTETTDDITLDTGGRELFIKNGGEAVVNFSNGGGIVPSMIIYAWNGNTVDYLQISTTGNNGEAKIETVDAAGSDADLTLDPDGDLLITPNTNVNINLASGGEFILQENSGTYTPSADTHVATKKYVDDNAGGTVTYFFKWGGQSGRNLVSAGYHMAIPFQYDGTYQNFGNSTDPDTSKTLSSTGDHFNNILVDFHDAITITGAYVTFGEGGSTNTTHNFHLMRYDVDADGDLSNGVVVATATNSNSDDYTHRRRATMSLSGTSADLNVSTSQALIGMFECPDGTNTYSSYRYNIKYTLQ